MPIFTLHLEVKGKVCIFDLGPAAGWEEFLFDCRLGVRMFPRLGKMIGWLWWIYVCMQHAVKRHKENMLFWLQGCRLAPTTNVWWLLPKLITDTMIFGIYLGYVLGLKNNFFVEKRTKYIFPGTQCQNSADSLTKTTPNAPNFISSICLPKPKNGISLVEKKSSSGFRSPNQLVFRHTIIYEAALPFMWFKTKC